MSKSLKYQNYPDNSHLVDVIFMQLDKRTHLLALQMHLHQIEMIICASDIFCKWVKSLIDGVIQRNNLKPWCSQCLPSENGRGV